jgi:hypothetical protein
LKAHVVTLRIIDMDDIGADEIKVVIENAHYPNRCISPDVVNIETADIGEWDDDHPLNSNATAAAEWNRLFPSLTHLAADAGLTRWGEVGNCTICGKAWSDCSCLFSR